MIQKLAKLMENQDPESDDASSSTSKLVRIWSALNALVLAFVEVPDVFFLCPLIAHDLCAVA